jgi:hypothetical protein
MTGQCRILERDLLISKNLLDNLEISDDYAIESVGEAQLRGKESYTNLFYIYPKNP